MREFADLHLRPLPDDISELKKMLCSAVNLGYSGVAVTLNNTVRGINEICQDMCLDFISRVDLKPRNAVELKSSLRHLRRRFEVIAVECLTKTVARQAAKDHRVDILNFSPFPSIRGRVQFDRQEANLASGSNCNYEVNTSDILNLPPPACARLLSIIRREIENAKRYEIPILISSGAESHRLMREPRGLAALLDLVGVGEEEGLDMISTVPWRLVELNRVKLSPKFISPGVRVVDRNDC
jgi:ribonuclease P/MRP protein subunit RPP1